MTQQNLRTGKTRAIQCRTSHRGSGPVAVAAPGAAPPSAPPAPVSAAPPAKTQRKGSALGGLGLAVVGGVCDLGDITAAAAEAGDGLADLAEDAAEAIAEVGADAQEAAVE